MAPLLAEPYYSDSHEVFRRATNQTDVMLDRLVDSVAGSDRLTILSVGSGAGLFEMPMLARLRDEGITVSRFVGVDPSAHAGAELERKLAGYEGLDFESVTAPFETYETHARFDLVLFNHVLEYLHGDALTWIRKSLGLVRDGGNVMVFSPNRGGINQIYEDVIVELVGMPPLFADGIEALLGEAAIAYVAQSIAAACDVSALERARDDREKLMLLSFLTQRDCREVPVAVRGRYIDYYLSLRQPNATSIPHPATLFVL